MQTIKITENERKFLEIATRLEALAGIFDYENNTAGEFKSYYQLTKDQTNKIAKSLRKKIKV